MRIVAIGDTGEGKTHLLRTITRLLRVDGYAVVERHDEHALEVRRPAVRPPDVRSAHKVPVYRFEAVPESTAHLMTEETLQISRNLPPGEYVVYRAEDPEDMP